MRRTIKRLVTLVIVSLLAFVVACAPAPGEITPTPAPEEAPTPAEVTPTPAPEEAPTPAADWGIIEIRVTDPGVVGVNSAIVTAKNIEIHPAGADDNEWITIITDPEPFDLVYLAETEGEQILGEARIAADNFTGIRMDVIQVVGWTDEDPSREYKAEVPSGKLRIVRPFNVGGDGVKTILTLDFDLSRSLITRVIKGEDKFLFKPVVRLKVAHSSPPATSEELEFEGTIEEMPADTPWIGEWVVDGQTVIVDADTVIEGTPEIDLIAEVEVLVQPDDSLLAIKIKVEEEK